MLSDRLVALIRNPETPTYVLRDAVMEEERPVASVWVVVGMTGEYSDKRTWTVAAYLEKEAAESLRDRLTEWVKEKGLTSSRGEYNYLNPLPKPDEDPNFGCDYTGVWYDVEEIPLRVEETV